MKVLFFAIIALEFRNLGIFRENILTTNNVLIDSFEIRYNNLEIMGQKTKHYHKFITEPDLIEMYLCVLLGAK